MKCLRVSHSYQLLKLALGALLSVVISGADASDAIETPPTANASAVLGILAKGGNYQVAPLVRSDGFLEIFTVQSTVGTFTVSGRQLLNRRINELNAIAALDKLSKTDLFTQSLVKSAASPVKFGIDLLRNPFGTVDQTVSVVTDAFGKIGAGATNPGGDPDSLAASAIGVSAAKRQLAAKLDVDPYTDFKPISDKLNDIATTMALGGLGPKAAFSLIGGGVGMALSYSSTADGVRDLVRDKTPAQLIEFNTQRLRAMGVDDKTAHAFLANDFYTITDQTRLIEALRQLGNVGNRSVFVERAADVNARDLAFFLVRRAEMIADYQKANGGAITQFVSANGFPVNILANGQAVIIAPIDLLAWSPTPLQALAAVSSGLRSNGKDNNVELRISGSATPGERLALKGMGWTVLEAKSN
jgi:hypothetical protein